MENLSNKSYENRIEDIKNNLFCGGGIGQAEALIYHLMDETSDKDTPLSASCVLRVIANMIDNYTRMINETAFVPVELFMSGKPGYAYPCLDNDLKFCVMYYGTDDWNYVKYVIPYYNVYKANEIINKHNGH